MKTASFGSTQIPLIWKRAALLGSLWAAVEIILGSFLHNLRIPMSGTILAAIGVVIMIQGYRLWSQPGLLWRTALITATMKAVSPSAVILGPMVGIFMEGVLLEVMLRLWRGRWPGVVMGAALAVSWSLIQKALVLLMTFGTDIIAIYEQLYLSASKSLGFDSFEAFDLILLLLSIDMLLGATVGLLTFRLSRPGQQSLEGESITLENSKLKIFDNPEQRSQQYSLALLVLNILILPIGLIVLSRSPLLTSSLFIFIYTIWNTWRYRRSQAQLRRPRLWISFIVIVLLSGVALGWLQNGSSITDGLIAGYAMILRGFLFITVLSALSIEVRNPRFWEIITRRGMAPFFSALRFAFTALPGFIAIVGQQQKTWRSPQATLTVLFNSLLSSEPLISQQYPLLIITGDPGSGKTTLLKEVLILLKANRINAGGFITPGYWYHGERAGYDLLTIETDEIQPLCKRGEGPEPQRSGPYVFKTEAIESGNHILRKAATTPPDIVIIDEIGPLELRGGGWRPSLDILNSHTSAPQIWVVRPTLVDVVIQRWGLQASVMKVSATTADDVLGWIQALATGLNNTSEK